MKRRNFVRIAAGASLGAGFGSLFAAKGEAGNILHSFYTNPQIRRFGDCRDWFFEKRFGMFVHWGLYAIPGWHEQHQWRSLNKYQGPGYISLNVFKKFVYPA